MSARTESMLRRCIFVLVTAAAIAAPRATIDGRVIDAAGKPVATATVIVYAAGVKVGYSTFCPTCCVDCGKRVVTSAQGDYRIQSLDPTLWSRLLVAREGFTLSFVMKVAPADGPAENAVLTLRSPVEN